MPVPESWGALVGGYINFLVAAGHPSTTVATRRGHLARIARQLHPIDPGDITGIELRNWFAAERLRRQWKRETHRGYRNSAAGFFGWAYREGHLDTDLARDLPAISPDRPVPKPTPDRIWRAAKMAADRRVMLMLRLVNEGGLRRAEVAQVNTADLREGLGGPQLVVHGKGARERVIPITEDLAAEIERGPGGHTKDAPPEGWLFPGQVDGHLSPRRVGELCSAVMPGIWTMHSIRHRFATNAFRGTRNLRAVMELLGHSSLAVTQRYVATDDDEMRAAMMAAVLAS